MNREVSGELLRLVTEMFNKESGYLLDYVSARYEHDTTKIVLRVREWPVSIPGVDG